MEGSAVISACGRYRYRLNRYIDHRNPPVVFVMLNPSTADAERDDPTIRRCLGFAQRWKKGKLVVLNLFNYRATKPAELWEADEPLGEYWSVHLLTTMRRHPGALWVAAWGSDKRADTQAYKFWRLLKVHAPYTELYCLGKTKGGRPKHPLYLPYSAELEIYEPPSV